MDTSLTTRTDAPSPARLGASPHGAPHAGGSSVRGDFVFVETAAQVAWLVSPDGRAVRGGVVVAITPAAALACQEVGVEYARVDDFVSTTNHRSSYGAAVTDLIAWIEWLDEWARGRIPAFGATAFRPADATSFRFVRLHGEIWGSAHIFAELLDSVRPRSVTLWGAPSASVPLDLEPRYDPTIALLADAARQRGIAVTDLATHPHSAASTMTAPVGDRGMRARLRESLLEGPVRPIAAAARGGGLSDVIRAVLPARKSAPRVLACGFGYDVQRLVVALRREGVNAVQTSNRLRDVPAEPGISDAVTRSVDALLAAPELWRPIDREAVARPRLWAAAVEQWWLGVVPRLWSNFPAATAALGPRTNALLLTDVGSADFGSVARQAAASAGVPAFLYQHGGSSDLDTPTLLPWVANPDGLLVYGEETARDLLETVPDGVGKPARIHPVGSTRLDEIGTKRASASARRLRATLRRGDDRPLVLYVPTHFAPHFRAVGQLADLPTVPYFELLQRILGVFAQARDVRLVFKAFGVANDTTAIIPDLVRRTVPDAIVTETPIRDLMWTAEAIVADHVITAATELLLTNAPCVFYMPAQTPAAQRARELLRRAAVVADTQDDFVHAVRTLVTSDVIVPVAQRDRAFIRAYGTFRDDGRSARRAAAVIGRARGVA